MLQPKRTKFRKVMKGRNTGLAHRANKVSFGEYGLKATSRGRITARQIEAARRTMTRRIKRGGKNQSHLLGKVKRDIARVKTVLNEKAGQ